MNYQEKVQKINTTTVGELGPRLPLGIFKDGAWHKALDFKRWRMKEERELGRLNEESGNLNMGGFISTILANMAVQFGPYDFSADTMKKEQKLLHISMARVPDIFYAYIHLRIKALGNNLNMTLTCPNRACNGHNFQFVADLNSMDVKTAETIEDASWTYKVKDPFVIRDKEVHAINFFPPLWNVMENMKGVGERNTGEQKAKVILGSIKSIILEDGTEEQLVMTVNELDEMSKVDLEKIYIQLNDNGIGPEMIVGCECPKCGKEFKTPIHWSYEHFFGASSL